IATVAIGAGQAGLSAGYPLSQRGLPFAILDADDRIGDHWRDRWDSLKLYSPARYDSPPGVKFPGPPFTLPGARRGGPERVLHAAGRPGVGRLPARRPPASWACRSGAEHASSASSPSTA